MRIVFLLTYPIYHDFWTTQQWLALENQNRWIPGVLAQMGHEVEYWAVDHEASIHVSRMEGFGNYTIRLFPADQAGKRTKFHYSDALVAHARRTEPDLFLLKGVDGGIGTRLIARYLKPQRRPFVFILGGQYYARYVPDAEVVIYETAYQRDQLTHPGWRFFWRRRLRAERLIRMSKSVDTTLFCPMAHVEKKYDVIAVGRLVQRHKSYEELGVLSEELQVAVIGSGPEADALRRQHPKISWLGQVPNDEVPKYLNQARLFLHPGAQNRRPTRDFFPRVIAEAAACGLPCTGFSDLIMPDVIPPGCGLRLDRNDFVAPIKQLLTEPERLRAMSLQARVWAETTLHKHSCRPALEATLKKLKHGQ